MSAAGRLLPVVLSAVALTGAPGRAAAERLFERDVVEVAMPSGTEVAVVGVDNPLGDAVIRGHDRDTIVVFAYKRGPDRETLERLKVSLVPDPSGRIAISASLAPGVEATVPAGSVSIDLEVLVPRAAFVSAQIWKGQARVSNVDNGAEVTNNEGDIDVVRVSGAVTTHSVHGNQQLSEILGAVEALGLEGDLDFNTIHGPRLAAMVHRGRILGRDIRVRDLQVTSARGNVSLDVAVQEGGSYRVHAYRGHVELRFSGGAPVRVTARSRDGRVRLPRRLDITRDESSGIFYGTHGSGRSPADLDLRSRTGNVTVGWF